jgi:hypothetical protein
MRRKCANREKLGKLLLPNLHRHSTRLQFSCKNDRRCRQNHSIRFFAGKMGQVQVLGRKWYRRVYATSIGCIWNVAQSNSWSKTVCNVTRTFVRYLLSSCFIVSSIVAHKGWHIIDKWLLFGGWFLDWKGSTLAPTATTHRIILWTCSRNKYANGCTLSRIAIDRRICPSIAYWIGTYSILRIDHWFVIFIIQLDIYSCVIFSKHIAVAIEIETIKTLYDYHNRRMSTGTCISGKNIW